MEWTGGCLCGDIRFRITKGPDGARHCHCTLCRRQTGAAFTTGVRFATEAFEWTKGKPVYFRDPVGVDRSFCARCGSSMTWEPPRRDDTTVFAGSLDRAEDEHLAHERIQDTFGRCRDFIEKYRGRMLELFRSNRINGINLLIFRSISAVALCS